MYPILQSAFCVFVNAPVAAAMPRPAPTAAAPTIVQNHQRVYTGDDSSAGRAGWLTSASGAAPVFGSGAVGSAVSDDIGGGGELFGERVR